MAQPQDRSPRKGGSGGRDERRSGAKKDSGRSRDRYGTDKPGKSRDGRDSKKGRPPERSRRDDSRGSTGRQPAGQRYDRGRRDDEVDPRTKSWGRVARRGATHMTDAGAAKAFKEAGEQETRTPWEPEEWIDEGPIREEAEAAVERGRVSAERPKAAKADPDTEPLKRKLPKNRRESAERDVKRAAKAFQREHFKDAEKLLRPLYNLSPDDLTVLELFGLTLYRLERWRAAAEKLERFSELTGSVEQHPVIADCRRALGQHKRVAEVWDELREEQAPAAIMAEGRIVYAGDLADQGDLAGAIRELERSPSQAKKPKVHHLRLRYALADLYERAGDLPQARELFESIATHRPDFFDVERRLSALG